MGRAQKKYSFPASIRETRVYWSDAYALDRSRALYAHAAAGPEYAYPACLQDQHEPFKRSFLSTVPCDPTVL